jgi:hypothetical protein
MVAEPLAREHGRHLDDARAACRRYVAAVPKLDGLMAGIGHLEASQMLGARIVTAVPTRVIIPMG